jgi:micrococcal nuclease
MFRMHNSVRQWVANLMAASAFVFIALIVFGVLPAKSALPNKVVFATPIQYQPESYPSNIPVSIENVYVTDGDTIKYADHTYRLMGFDTPETFRSRCNYELTLGLEAKAYLLQRLRSGKIVMLHWKGVDKYKRRLAVLTIDGHDVARDMIEAELAVEYHGKGKRIDWCTRQKKSLPMPLLQ